MQASRVQCPTDVVTPETVRTNRARRKLIALAALASVLALFLCELILHFTLGNLDIVSLEVEPSDGRCVALEANSESRYTGMMLPIDPVTHRVNEHGYRGPARPQARAASVTRMLALGDSFTFGQGVEDSETLPAQLETALREGGMAQAEVLNFGIPGLNLEEMLDQYRGFARHWEAQYVLVFLFEKRS